MFVDENTIDVSKDSVSAMMKKLMNRATKGNVPEGGLDIPAATFLGAAPSDRADYSVEIRNVFDNPDLSFDPWLVPPVVKPEPVAKTSESPFKSPFLDSTPTGLFGKALQAHVKLIAVLRGYNSPIDDCERTFKAMWGLAENVDLEPFYISTRSTGAALYGGIKRKTVPYCSAMTSTQVNVDITDHGQARSAFGKDALVDWPRGKSIAMATGVQLAGDDEVFRRERKPLHYRIVKAEVPKAPKHVEFPKMPVFKTEEVMLTQEAVAGLANQMRKFSVVHGHKHEHLDIDAVAPKNIIESVRAVPKGFLDKTENRLFDEVVDFDVGTWDDEREHLTYEDLQQVRKIRPVDVIKSFAIAYADKERGNVPRAAKIRHMLVELDGDYTKAHSFLLDVCQRIIPHDILVRVFFLGNFVGEKAGLNWVNDVRKYLNCRHGMFSERDLIKSWKESLADLKFVKRLSEEIAAGLSKYELIVLTQPKVTHSVQKKLAHSQTFALGLGDIIHAHAVYWHNRYINKVVNDDVDRITNQLLAKVFRKIKLRVDDELTVQHSIRETANVLHDAAENFIRKRKHLQEGEGQFDVPIYSGGNLLDYAGLLDVYVGKLLDLVPKVNFYNFALGAEKQVALFVDDIRDFLERVLNYEDANVPHDYGEAEFVDVQNKPEIKEQKQEVVPEPEVAKTGLFGAVKKPTGFGMLRRAPKKIQSQDVDLRQELKDDGIDITNAKVQLALGRYPRMVHWKEVKRIREEILEVFKH